MGKVILVAFILILSASTAFSQNNWLKSEGTVGRVEIGYESGFNFDLGYGLWWLIDADDFLLGFASATIGYDAYIIENKFFGGPKLNFSYYNQYFVCIGMSASYINSNSNWKPVIKPEIGLTMSGIVSIIYSYTINNVENFFPASYSKHGLHLKVNIPITY